MLQTARIYCVAVHKQVLRVIDEQPNSTAAMEQALRGVFAGNIFDLGAAESAQRYEQGNGAGFHHALEQLLPRPWVSMYRLTLLPAASPGVLLLAALLIAISLLLLVLIFAFQGEGAC